MSEATIVKNRLEEIVWHNGDWLVIALTVLVMANKAAAADDVMILRR